MKYSDRNMYESLNRSLDATRKSYEDLNERILRWDRNILKNRIRRGEEVSEEDLRRAKTTRYSLEMSVNIDRMREDPVKYFQEVRKQVRKDAARERRDNLLRPFKKLLDRILRRR